MSNNREEIEVAIPTPETDPDASYDDAICVLSTKSPKVDLKLSPAGRKEDNFRRNQIKKKKKSCLDFIRCIITRVISKFAFY